MNSLQGSGAQQQATALLHRAAACIPLDDPGAVALLLTWLREKGAHEQATALLRRDPAAHIPLDDPNAVGQLLVRLRWAGAQEQLTTLLRRDPAAHVSLNNPGGVRWLLLSLGWAGAQEQLTTLLRRDPAAHVSIYDLPVVGLLVDSLRQVERTSRPPRWPTDSRGQARSSASARWRAGIGSGLAGRLMATQPGHGDGKIWTDAAMLNSNIFVHAWPWQRPAQGPVLSLTDGASRRPPSYWRDQALQLRTVELRRIRQKITSATEVPFCAPPTDRTERIVPVQIGGTVRFLSSRLRYAP